MNYEQLKNSILQEAIEGRLVPQDPNDEPASALLDRIAAEKAELVKAKKIKKDKDESRIYRTADGHWMERFSDKKRTEVCIDDEIPFEIPTSWEWSRLRSVGDWGAGATPQRGNPAFYENGNIPWVKTGELNNSIIRDCSEKITNLALRKCSLRLCEIGDVLIAMYGATIGKLAIAGMTLTTNQACCACTPFHGIDNWYLFYFLMASKPTLIKMSEGGAQPNISRDKIINFLFPVPPQDEQHRIVAKLEAILPKVEAYGRAQDKLDALNAALPEKLKNSILQEAIEGRLVPQNADDEPAAALLDRIHEEKERLIKEKKIKRDKNESRIYRTSDGHWMERFYDKKRTELCIDDEIPFDIPASWEWTRIGYVFDHNTGKALNGKGGQGQSLTYITTSNLYWNRFELDNLKSMNFKDSEIDKCTIKKGDLLVCEGGDYGRAAIWNENFNMRIQNHIHRLRSYLKVQTLFFYYIFLFYKGIGLISGKGIGIQGLSSGALHNIVIPFPSLQEQYRITAQLGELLPKVNNIIK